MKRTRPRAECPPAATKATYWKTTGTQRYPNIIKRKIIAFHQDEHNHWVADLECGHTQHVRHDPPWTIRAWVATEEGRRSHIGHELDCKKCGPAVA